MTFATGTAMVVAALDVAVAARYCQKLLRGQTRPRIATWLIFELGVVMSLAAYFSSHDHSLVKAALNLTDSVLVTVIVGLLLFVQRGETLRFTRNEGACLAIAGVTAAAWAVTRTPWVGFAGFQLLMTVAYLPTIEHVWQWKRGRAPEPVEAWAVNAAAALLGCAVDVTGRRDYVAMLYPLRAFVLCMTIVVLLLRWRRKSAVVATSAL